MRHANEASIIWCFLVRGGGGWGELLYRYSTRTGTVQVGVQYSGRALSTGRAGSSLLPTSSCTRANINAPASASGEDALARWWVQGVKDPNPNLEKLWRRPRDTIQDPTNHSTISTLHKVESWREIADLLPPNLMFFLSSNIAKQSQKQLQCPCQRIVTGVLC